MNKFRIFSVMVLISLIVTVAGCGGGGGSSAPVEKDVVGITSALNGYMTSLRNSDAEAAASFLARTAASETHTDSVRTLIVKDFGQKIAEKDEATSYTFYVNPADIVQASSEIAYVKAYYSLSSGEKIVLLFNMVKEDGRWLISSMELTTPSSTSHGDTSLPSQFVSASFFPVTPSQEHLLSIEYDTTVQTNRRLYYYGSSPTTASGTNFYPLHLSNINAGAAATSVRSAIRSAEVMPTESRQVYFGIGSDGAVYTYMPSTDPTKTYIELFLKPSYTYGSTNTHSTFVSAGTDGTRIPATATVQIGNPETFLAPLKTYTAVKVTKTYTFINPSTSTSESVAVNLYLAYNVGLVGEDWVDTPPNGTGANVTYKGRLLLRKNGVTVEKNDPEISTPTDLGTAELGSAFTKTFAYNSAKGTAPFTWSVDATSQSPFGSTPIANLLNSSTGVLSGTIDASQVPNTTLNIKIHLKDKYHRDVSKTFTLTLVSAAVGATVGGSDLTSANIGVLKSVPAGRFQRDSNPANISVITAPFHMSVNLITRQQFLAIMGADVSNTTTGASGMNTPVQYINWYHAIAFCNKLSIQEGLTPVYTVTGVNFSTINFSDVPVSTPNADWNNVAVEWGADGYRLPTEMEWMWAAMGADQDSRSGAMSGGVNVTGYSKQFSGSNGSNLPTVYAWFAGNSGYSASFRRTNTVGSLQANELGLHDMSGNVFEWCWDWYGSLPAGTLTNYLGMTSGSTKTTKGGDFGSPVSMLSPSYRFGDAQTTQQDWLGFRVMRVQPN